MSATVQQCQEQRRLSGDEIRAWIAARPGMSQRRLSELLGVGTATVEFWCQGRTQAPPYLWRLLRDLDEHDLSPGVPTPSVQE